MASAPDMPYGRLRRLYGAAPGLVDPSQPQRLLHTSASKLAFATFDARTASSKEDLTDISRLRLQDDLNNAKRIVIETTPQGVPFWRFVPRAKWDDGVTDEGVWPRSVELSGELVEMDQDQWDVYKLDPYYECRVRPRPAPPLITAVLRQPPQTPAPATGTRKRAMAPPTPPDSAPGPSDTEAVFGSSGEEEDEVADMIVDEMMVDQPEPPLANAKPVAGPSVMPTPRTQRVREGILREREQRRAKISRRTEKISNPPVNFNFEEHIPRPPPPPPDNKRNLGNVNGCLKTPPDTHYTERIDTERNPIIWEAKGNTKRNRTMSPGEARRKIQSKRSARERAKLQRLAEEREARVRERERLFQQGGITEAQRAQSQGPEASSYTRAWTEQPDEPETIVEEDEDIEVEEDRPQGRAQTEAPQASGSSAADSDERNDSIAESMRKLAELDRDRPLWEEAARTRQARERAEEEANRAAAEERQKAEARRRAEEALRKARAKEQAAAAKDEEARRKREERAQHVRAEHYRQMRWVQWNDTVAVNRFIQTGQQFDRRGFTLDDPVTFDLVPWPILKRPLGLGAEDIDFASVEEFFRRLEQLRPHDYRTLLKQAQIRFHPDRWRAKNVYGSVDDAEKDCMETAVTTVSQTVTQLRG
ncbi:hypothetical protein CYLTODRAFT_493897 [Cylindrobasidium torrendii FP15055 ss-10]|uniref:J domain-containing protein n=1 Tax=Cylindrobasidium torrendii FP15055 ss-10 TaxID=1314674 RepID=A0A0D7AZW5_9AGAR|nr:hypothetical protein CYLTODRAFT_493897 [Cylindrobasidium torrendii FP15055 ss-10]